MKGVNRPARSREGQSAERSRETEMVNEVVDGGGVGVVKRGWRCWSRETVLAATVVVDGVGVNDGVGGEGESLMVLESLTVLVVTVLAAVGVAEKWVV